MHIVSGRTYRVVVKFPWGGRFEGHSDRVSREPGGEVRWCSDGSAWAGAACLDVVIQETEHWVLGLIQGYGDVTVVVSENGQEAPEP